MQKQQKITNFFIRPPKEIKSDLTGREERKKPQCKRRKSKTEIDKNMRGYWVCLAAKNKKRKDDHSPCSTAVDALVQSPTLSPNGAAMTHLKLELQSPLIRAPKHLQ